MRQFPIISERIDNVKRVIAFALIIAISGTLWGCGRNTDSSASVPAESTSPENTIDYSSPDAFTVDNEILAFAIAMAHNMGAREQNPNILYNVYLWETAGWYSAYLYRTEGKAYLSRSEVKSIQNKMGNKGFSEMPYEWQAYSYLNVSKSESGETVYEFSNHKQMIDDYLGIRMESILRRTDNGDEDVILRWYNDNGIAADSEYTIQFGNDSMGESVVMNVVFPIVKNNFGYLFFSKTDLIKANNLNSISRLYSHISSESEGTNADGSGYSFGYEIFLDGDEKVRSSHSPDGETVSGICNGFYIYSNETGKKTCVSVNKGKDFPGFDDVISCQIPDFYYANYFAESDTTLCFSVSAEYGTEYYSVNKFNYLLESYECSYNNGDYFITSYTYDFDMLPEESDLKQLFEETRTVSVKYYIYSDGEEISNQLFEVPANAEFLTYEQYALGYNAWMNEKMTIPYCYPGDGIDYSFIVTNAVG